MPDCHLFLYEELIAYDHLTSNGIVILNLHTDGDLGAQYAAAQWRAEELADTIRHYNPQPQEQHHQGESVVRSNLTKEQYSQMVQDAKEYIRNGDIFQIVLSQRFEISNPPDSFSVYRKLRATNPSPYLYYFHTPEYDVAGASPEMLAKVTNGKFRIAPLPAPSPEGGHRKRIWPMKRRWPQIRRNGQNTPCWLIWAGMMWERFQSSAA